MRNIFGVKFIVAATMLISFKVFAVSGIIPNGSAGVFDCDLPGVYCNLAPTISLDVGVPKKVTGATASVFQGKTLPTTSYIALTLPGMLPNTIYTLKIAACAKVRN